MNAAKTRRRKPGIVAVLLALLIVSLGLRVGQAAVNESPAAAEGPAPVAEALPETGAQCTEPAMAAMLDDLLVREKKVKDSESVIGAREAKIAEAETRLATGIETLKAAQDRLQGTLDTLSEAQEGDITSLVATYEAMKPDQAVALFAAMAPEFAAEFIRRMKPEAAAPILAGLDPKQAYALSVLLAGRSAAKIEAAAPVAEPASAGEPSQ
jgi:flagellar motility protein MotE (MotC chaperone)